MLLHRRKDRGFAEPDPLPVLGPPSGTDNAQLGRRAGVGFMWQALSFVTGKVVVAAATIVLARILAPAEFGLVAIATVFIGFADAVSDAGAGQALVYFERTAAMIRAALLVSFGTGVALAGFALLLSNVVASYYDQASVAPLMRILAVGLLFSAVAAPFEALLRAAFAFRRAAVATAVRALVFAAVAVPLAASGIGATALALGTVAGSLSYLVATAALSGQAVLLLPGRPTRMHVMKILRYGLPSSTGMLLSKVIFDLDYVFVGMLGTAALGIYTIAFRLPELAIIQVFFVLSSVAFPLYSRVRQEPTRLRRAYLTSLRLQSLYGIAAGVGLAVVSPVLVPSILGSSWAEAAPPLAVLSGYAAVRSLSAGANDVYRATGRPHLTMWVAVLRLIVLAPALWFATRWGILGVAVTQLVLAALFAVLMQSIAARIVGSTRGAVARALAPGGAAGAAVLVAAGGVVLWCPGPPTAVLVVATIAGAAAAGAVSLLTARDVIGLVVRRETGGPTHA